MRPKFTDNTGKIRHDSMYDRHNEYYVFTDSGGYMTDRELKRLSRAELLEMLLAQIEENKALKEQLQETRDALEDRQIVIEKAGTMAEAALQLNGVFEAADRAARQYLENIRRKARESRGEL